METVQQNGRFTLFSSKFLSIYSIPLYIFYSSLYILFPSNIYSILYDEGSMEVTLTVPKGLKTKFKMTFLFKERRAQFTMVPLNLYLRKN